MAAVLLTTSCSKDEDNNDAVKPDTTKQANTETEQQGVPFTIKVVTGKKLSKIAYEDKGAIVQPSFTKTDENSIYLDIYNLSTKTTYFSVPLTDYTTGTFSGNITTEPTIGENVGARITKTGGFGSDYSTESLTDLMEKCTHRFEGSFKYGSDNTVTLIDQNAYFEIFMSPLQHELSVKIDNSAESYPLNDEGKIWIRVSAGIHFETNFYSKTSPEAGTIYSIDRSGYVDLGLSNSALWADKNVGATTYDGAGDYYNYNDGELSSLSLPTGNGANDADFTILKNECTWKFVFDENDNSIIKGFNVFKKNASNPDYDPHIFLPAAGCKNSTDVLNYAGEVGFYWSGSLGMFDRYALKVDNSWGNRDEDMCIDDDYYSYTNKYTVRTVLHKSNN